ncbi:uncharacterized protein [Nicotiana tomentosiformis]|uniref:uncharacterized protein n=1 Tax=Nicotiana tomentosiformis TaxID=4098 RepID=UPI00388CC380
MECHDTLWAGHPAEECTSALLYRAYYWPQMAEDVAKYVKTSLVCQKDKSDRLTQAGLLEPLLVPKRPWESVSLDFIIGLPKQPLLLHTMNAPNMSKSPRAVSFSKEWKKNLEIVRSYLVKAQKRMKKHADQNRRFVEYQVGDKVIVKISKQYLFAGVHDPHILQKYIGPLSIEKRIRKVAYWVDTPAWWKIHPVFHISLLKPFREDMEDHSRIQLTVPSIQGPNSTGKMWVEAILDDRVIHASRKDHQEFLVKWQGCNTEKNTWEKGTNLKAYKSPIEDYLASKEPRTS